MTKQIIFPTVHRNGTSQQELLDGLAQVCSDLNTAIESLCKACPNGRDYYVGPNSLSAATAQYRARLDALVGMRMDIEKEMEAICDQE